ncbi:MAG: ThiF family adenylyltransferase [Thermodesulfobacteriota bacterium]
MNYEELFFRNFSIFTREEQEKIRRGRVLIVGCGGIGGTVAVILARSGVEHFTLLEFDRYDLSNMNRQIGCFAETIGRNKAEVIRDLILRINPQADVKAHSEMLTHSQIASLMPDVDLVFPAADDLAFSVFIFRDARRLGKPALLVLPSGTWANVSLIPPSGPTVEDVQGVPQLDTYEELREVLEVRRYKLGTYFYIPLASWRPDYYRRFLEEGARPTQICPIVWIASSLGALEILKWLSGKWPPVAAPRYWYITSGKIKINRLNWPSLGTLLVWQRLVMWKLFQTWFAPALGGMQKVWWKFFDRWVTAKQERQRIRSSVGVETSPEPDYQERFQRNYGIFEDAEQEKIRRTKVLVVGCTGSGETVSIILARCGIENFILVDETSYQPSDMNRQPGCFVDTIGAKKGETTAREIQAINPQAKVEVVTTLPLPHAFDDLVRRVDLVIPAHDDLPYSLMVFRSARRLGKTAILCLPSGVMGWVSVFEPEGQTLEDALGVPKKDYGDLQAVVKSPEYKCAQYNFITRGDWQMDWFFDYFKGQKPLALICSVEWIAASLAALEALKVVSGKWKPMVAPRCWYISKARIRQGRFSRFVCWHRKLGWMIFSSRTGKILHRPAVWFWHSFFSHLGGRRKDRGPIDS